MGSHHYTFTERIASLKSHLFEQKKMAIAYQHHINTMKVATTGFVNPSETLSMLEATPKILAKPTQINSGGQTWFAPAGIRRGGPTPTFPSEAISTEASLDRVGPLRWKLLTLSFDDLIGMQDMGVKYRFEKVSTNDGEEIQIVFESDTDEAMSLFYIRPKKNEHEHGND